MLSKRVVACCCIRPLYRVVEIVTHIDSSSLALADVNLERDVWLDLIDPLVVVDDVLVKIVPLLVPAQVVREGKD